MGIGSARLAELFAEHAVRLRRLAFGVLRDLQASEDVVQATFAKAAQEAETIHPEALKSWLYRVAFHEAITLKRRSSVHEKALTHLRRREADRDGAGPDEPLVQSEVVAQVRKAMQRLPERQQRVVRERIYEGKTFAQIATEMNAPLGTVLTHMRRALERLRRALDRQD
jgi:RNA polymerase sigma-70 factor (ECF subfamily)